MLSPWLLLLLLSTLAWVIAGSRYPMDWPGAPEAPTCEELRAFWETVSQMSRMGQVTNQIPVVAGQQIRMAMDHLLRDGQRAKSARKSAKDAYLNRLDFLDPFSKDVWVAPPPPSPISFLIPVRPQTPSDRDVNGMFGEFHEQSPEQYPTSNHYQAPEPEMFGFGSPSAVPSEAKKNGESEFYIPQWGSPDEVDTFGSFVDFDSGSLHRAMTRTPKNTAGEWSDLPANQESSQVTCDVLMNTDCTTNEQCLCRGRKKLTCIHRKCLSHDQNSDIGEKYGTWHDGPIPQSQLRLLSSSRKRNYKSIFM